MRKIARKFARGIYTPRDMQLENSSLLEPIDVDVLVKVSFLLDFSPNSLCLPNAIQ